MTKPATIDAYLARLPGEQRIALEKIRKAIRAAAPRAEECFSYGLPAFRDAGGLVAGFGASAKHCAYYPMSGSVVSTLESELQGYATSKGAIRFEAAKPLPATLIRKLVKARQAENAGTKTKTAKRSTNKTASRSKAALKPAKRVPTAPRDVGELLAKLERGGSSKLRADMSARYGIVTKDRAFGTPMAKIQLIARRVGRDHDLAEALWQTGVYEARMLASMVDEPERVTAAQMNRWAKDFDNWAVVDTLCFKLFDRVPCAFAQVTAWSRSKDEFVKRAAFALLASTALHGHGTEDDFARALPLVELASSDGRNFVKKGVSWALRAIGGKKSPKLRAAARALGQRLAKSDDPAARWIGKDALRAFGKNMTGPKSQSQ
jgi:3-methyladenine DNA glycosylase AlkD/uncharacterized protein YdhG (YjbR/CyaY superfamily)